jgi:hypothetical protein
MKLPKLRGLMLMMQRGVISTKKRTPKKRTLVSFGEEWKTQAAWREWEGKRLPKTAK